MLAALITGIVSEIVLGQGKVETEAELDQRRPGEIAFGAIWLAFIAGDIALTTVTESAPSPLYWALLAYSAWGLVTVFGVLHLKAWAHWSFLIIVTLYFFNGLSEAILFFMGIVPDGYFDYFHFLPIVVSTTWILLFCQKPVRLLFGVRW